MLDSTHIVEGFVEPGFEAVADEFERNFQVLGDIGAAFAAYHRGRLVVDLWGGQARSDRQWSENTLQLVFSGTKGLLAGCILILVERDQLDLDSPVARYWPEFAQNGKERVLVRHVVSHRAGIPGVVAPLALKDIPDFLKIEALLAEQAIANDPDAFACYHGLTIGWLCGALIRRIDGRTFGQFFADEVANPLSLEAWIGLPEREEDRVSVIEIEKPQDWNDGDTSDPINNSIWNNPPLFDPDAFGWNTRAFHAAEIGGAGGIATARSMAKYYGCLSNGGEIDGIRILRDETIQAGLKERSRFQEPYFPEPMAFATVFALQTHKMRFGPATDAFGHSGAGGSIHGGWPALRTGFSYSMNQMRVDPEDCRSRHLLTSLHQIIVERENSLPNKKGENTHA